MADVGTAATVKALGEVRGWLGTWLAVRNKRSEEEKEAVRALLRAINRTGQYISSRKSGKRRNRKTEMAMSELWLDASVAMFHIDNELAALMQVKATAWSQPDIWSRTKVQEAGISLSKMSERAQQMLQEGKVRSR